MIYDLHPWKIDVDREGTAKLYEEKDFSLNKEWNKRLIAKLDQEALDFFDRLGVDLMNIEAEEKVLEFFEVDEEKQIMRTAADFFIKGNFIELPSWQAEIFEDEDILGKMPENMKKTDAEEMACAAGNLLPGVVFKPPFFRVTDGNLRVWDSGYIVGSLLIIEE